MIRFFWISLITLVAFTVGLGAGYLMDDASSIVVFPIDSTVFSIAVASFAFSLLFFGFSSPIVMFFIGAFVSSAFKMQSLPMLDIGLLTLASVFAAMAAIRLGDSLLEDMRGTGNFKDSMKITLILMALSLILSVGAEFVVTA